MNKVTEGQEKAIAYIEENLEIKFTGKTKEQARQFISRHIDASKEAREAKKNEAIRFIFELAEQKFKDDPENLEKVIQYKKLFS